MQSGHLKKWLSQDVGSEQRYVLNSCTFSPIKILQ